MPAPPVGESLVKGEKAAGEESGATMHGRPICTAQSALSQIRRASPLTTTSGHDAPLITVI
ncbi:MAG: hypothetical protein IT322_01725 [Anaerolineae bacterium]|nr:hypothetical protein [Anaerolineae bacterium]